MNAVQDAAVIEMERLQDRLAMLDRMVLDARAEQNDQAARYFEREIDRLQTQIETVQRMQATLEDAQTDDEWEPDAEDDTDHVREPVDALTDPITTA